MEKTPDETREQQIRKKAGSLYWNARQRATDKGISFSLSKEFIEAALKKGKCQATGVSFDFNESSGGKGQSNPWSPSLDRIDPNKGYTKKNVQVVALIYNRAKGADSEADVRLLARKLCQRTGHRSCKK
ncbi:MAG: hypothetical protein EP349_04905 [Alphaproteobacteria bacterium]|nr:MAG: hypothetical protein EP349_04905 [Alphaproteobacteria bacterium]